MGLFTRKIEKIFEPKFRNVEGAEAWIVSWDARYDHGYDYRKRVAKVFLDEDNARQFKENLLEAARLLQYTEDINIRVEKQV